jgi:hypothetical protein
LPSDTIINVPFDPAHPLHSLIQDASTELGTEVEAMGQHLFQIRAANSQGLRSSATILINRMYAARGYLSSPLSIQQLPTRITLVASAAGVTIGTITIGFDSAVGLNADDPFINETTALRAEGRHLCEFTKLAIDNVIRSKRVLASLFHVAYIYAYRLMRFDDLLIEVNPRHRRYYERMLGFEVRGQERINPRVNAPAVLLCLNFKHAQAQIALYGGRHQLGDAMRSLYPYFFSGAEEASILERLLRTQPDAAYTPWPSGAGFGTGGNND